MKTSDPKREDPSPLALRLGVASGALILVAAVVLLQSPQMRQHPPLPFPGTVFAKFLGSTPLAIAGPGNIVAVDGEPDVGVRAMIVPTKGRALTILGVKIYSSDKDGHALGGGKWDTYDESTRALGLVRDGKVINPGPKRMLRIEVSSPTVLDLYFADGTMMSFWKYFTLTIEAAGGLVDAEVIESKLARR